MERRLLVLMTAPTVMIGLLLFAACLISAWSVNHVQAQLSRIVADHVTSMEAAQDLEINLRKLRFHCYRYLIEPRRNGDKNDWLGELAADDRAFRLSLEEVERFAYTSQEIEYVGQIRAAYDRFQEEFQTLSRTPPPRSGYEEFSDRNPVRSVVEPCERYFDLNKEQMNGVRQESERVSHLLHGVLLLLGLVGPISGLLIGWSMARGLSRSMHRELSRAQQLSALGQLAASVAHEVRNPLMSIKMLVEAALRPHNPRPFTCANLQVVQSAVERLEKTVQGFLDFARPPALERGVCDLHSVASEALDLVRGRAGQQNVAAVLDCPQPPIHGDVDRVRFCAVLVNLCLNSLDAMPGGGRLEVRLRSEPKEVVLQILDTGTGITPEVAERLFTPFASGKPTGSGLGLCISKRIVEDHGGTLDGFNRPDGGACFTITLPKSNTVITTENTEKRTKRDRKDRKE